MLDYNKSQEFLDRFTFGMISIIKLNLELELKRKKREMTSKHSINVGKLMQRFSQYGETKGNIQIRVQQTQPIPQKIQVLPVIKPQPIIQPQIRPAQINLPNKNDLQRVQPSQQIQAIINEIDFGKVAQFIKDPLVIYVESTGEDKEVIIKKSGNTIKTQVILNKDEILSIIKSFSEKARIPLIEGMLNARLGNFEIAAIVSETATASFIIKKDLIHIMQPPSTLQKPMMNFQNNPISKPSLMPPTTQPFPVR